MGTKSLSQKPTNSYPPKPLHPCSEKEQLLQDQHAKQARANYPGFITMVLPEGVQCFCAYRAIPSHCVLKKLTLSEDEHRVAKPATVVELDTSIHDTASGTCGLKRDIRDISLFLRLDNTSATINSVPNANQENFLLSPFPTCYPTGSQHLTTRSVIPQKTCSQQRLAWTLYGIGALLDQSLTRLLE